MKCEFAHQAALPLDIEFGKDAEDPHELWIRAGGLPSYRVRLSTGWYRWLSTIAAPHDDAPDAVPQVGNLP